MNRRILEAIRAGCTLRAFIAGRPSGGLGKYYLMRYVVALEAITAAGKRKAIGPGRAVVVVLCEYLAHYRTGANRAHAAARDNALKVARRIIARAENLPEYAATLAARALLAGGRP